MPLLIKRIAIEKCDRRLKAAREALDQCVDPAFYDDFVKAWTDFLIAATAIPHILERAAGATPQARQWYGGKRNAGRKDELVLYMIQARNAEEHGLEPVTEFSPGEYVVQHPSGGMKLTDVGFLPDNRLFIRVKNADAHPHPRFGFKPSAINLAEVEDTRYKQIYRPPRKHNGQPINGGLHATPLQAGRLYLAYVSALVREAEVLE